MAERRIVLVTLADTETMTDGFAPRYDALEAAAAFLGPVVRVRIGTERDADLVVDPSIFAVGGRGRIRRGLGLLGLRGPLRRASQALATLVEQLGGDVVLGGCYRHLELLTAVSARYPTLAFAEEQPRGFGWGPTVVYGVKARGAAFIERRLFARALRSVLAVAVISGDEVAAAARRYHRPVVVVPHALDPRGWESRGRHPEPRVVLTVGNYAERRNVDGLVATLAALDRLDPAATIRVRCVSAQEPAPALVEAGGARLELLGAVEDLTALYDTAAACLVPSFVVWGAKTTVLQGWALGCPVVATDSAARSVGASAGVDCVVGDSPESLAKALIECLADPHAAQARAAAGLETLARAHSPEALSEILAAVLGGGGEGA